MGQRKGQENGRETGRRGRLRGTETAKKGSGMETESRGLLNVDLWVLARSPGIWPLPGRRDAKCHRFWLTYPAYISKTELNTPRGHRGTEEITSEFVKRP